MVTLTPTTPVVPPPAFRPVPPEPARGAETTHRLGTQKILAIVAGGVGVVALGVGASIGAVSLSKRSSAEAKCPSSSAGFVCPSQDDASQFSSADATGNVSLVMLIVGGASVAGAAVLWFTAPSSGGRSTRVGFGLGTIQLMGTW